MSETPDESALPASAPGPQRGARLRAAREAAGLSRDDVAARLRLSVRQVQALEDEETDELPSGPFVKGFVRNYARMLGRDPAEFDAGLAPAPSAVTTPPSLTPPQPPRRVLLESGRASANRRWLAAALVCLAVGGLGSWLTMEHLKSAGDLIARQAEPSLAQLGVLVGSHASAGAPAAPPSTASAGAPAAASAPAAPAVAVATPVAAAPTPTPAPVPAPAIRAAATAMGAPVPPAAAAGDSAAAHHLDLAASSSLAAAGAGQGAHALQVTAAASGASAATAAGRKLALDFDADCWVEVRDENNQVLWSGTSRAGDHRDIEAHGPVRIVVGNAPATRLSWNGRPVDLAEFTRLTVARLTLDPASDTP